MLAHLARILNILIDSDILFIKKKPPPFPGFEMCATNRVFIFYVFFFGSFFCFSWIQFRSRK